MGTRSTIKFYDNSFGKSVNVASIYQQWDGYPECKGLELAKFLNEVKVINGVNDRSLESKTANGAGCLAAQFIANMKNEVGSFYMTSADDEQEYNYKVNVDYDGIIIELSEDDFIGTPEEFIKKYA